MDVKEAVAKAKGYVQDIFADDGISDVRLEEVEFDESQRAWNITLGFLRRAEPAVGWSTASGLGAALEAISARTRSYRIVRIRDDDGAVMSVKQRDRVSDAA